MTHCSLLRVLIVDDDDHDFRCVRDLLVRAGGTRYAVARAPSYSSGLEALIGGGWDMCFVDYELDGRSGLEMIRVAARLGVRTPMILLTGHDDASLGNEVRHSGGDDYLLKWHLTSSVLDRAVRYALDRAALRAHVEQSENALRDARHHAAAMSRFSTLGQLVVGVAHDFINTLTVVTGEADHLKRSLSEDDPRRDSAQEVVGASIRAAALAHQMVSLSRQRPSEPMALNLNELVGGLECMLRRLVGQDVTLVTTFEPELSIVVADACQIEQVVFNLAVNARDAMPDGGCLSIELRNGGLDAAEAKKVGSQPGDYVVLSVTDNGTGMTEEIRARIFEPFYTTRKREGAAGLGLSAVRDIVERNAGAIAVSSEWGLGSTFEVYLPRFTPMPATSVR